MMGSRARYILAALVFGALVIAACVPVDGDQGPQRPEPSDPASGSVVATAASGQTTFVLYDEGEGCLAVDVAHPGLQRTVERGCFDELNTLRETSSCGWLTDDAPANGESSDVTSAAYDCDVTLPRVMYGRVTDPAVAFVCVGRFDFEGGGATGVVGARLLPRDADGYIFTVAGEGEQTPPHFLSAGGWRVGDEPLDAPSGPIYRFCEAQAGAEKQELVYNVDLVVDFDEQIRTDDVTVFFHAGLDRTGVSGDAQGAQGSVPLAVRVTPRVFDLEVEVETGAGPIMNTILEWPQQFRDIVVSGEACDGLTRVGVSIGAGVLDGDDQAIRVAFIGSDCGGGPVTTTTASTTSTTTAAPVETWEITTVDAEDYADADVSEAVGDIIRSDSVIEATIETLGNQNEGGRWCCESPPFTVTDIEVLNGEAPPRGGDLNGFGYQDLTKYLAPGDRVTMLLVRGTAWYVFGPDGGLVHPVAAPHVAEAINALREGEARWSGYDSGADISPLEAVSATANRYRDDWWGSIEQRASLALSGVPGYPETCSAADLAPFIEQFIDPRSFDGLPDAVAETRLELIDAATTCDYDAVFEMIPEPRLQSDDGTYGRDEFWWGATATPELFAESDRTHGNLRSLVFALILVPYGVIENEMEDRTFERYFTWPRDYGEVDSGPAYVDLVPQNELGRIAAINGMSVDELVEGVGVFGAYALFRVGIADDGQWMFALSGD